MAVHWNGDRNWRCQSILTERSHDEVFKKCCFRLHVRDTWLQRGLTYTSRRPWRLCQQGVLKGFPFIVLIPLIPRIVQNSQPQGTVQAALYFPEGGNWDQTNPQTRKFIKSVWRSIHLEGPAGSSMNQLGPNFLPPLSLLERSSRWRLCVTLDSAAVVEIEAGSITHFTKTPFKFWYRDPGPWQSHGFQSHWEATAESITAVQQVLACPSKNKAESLWAG